MAVNKVNIDQFLELATQQLVFDVRSPGEYLHAHFPGAYSLPLFTDEERKVVGTAYKQQSRQKAIKIGLEYFGKKMLSIVEEAEELLERRKDEQAGLNKTYKGVEDSEPLGNGPKTILVHCWRGGMRSAAIAWLLDLYGFRVYTLAGGYKIFRQWALHQFEKDYPFIVIGGNTGSGKTEVLHELKKKRQAVVDLENLANHKGSAFGNIGLPPQPSQEMFENMLALELWGTGRVEVLDDRRDMIDENDRKVSSLSTVNQQPSIGLQTSTLNLKPSTLNGNPSPLYIEDESQRIGLVNIPNPLWKVIRSKPVVFLDIPFEERLDYIVKGYGKGDKGKLIDAIIRIQKRLGPLEAKTAVDYLIEDDIKESFRILLKYYDKWYNKGLQSREDWQELVTTIECENVNAEANGLKILETKIKLADVRTV